MKDLRSIIAKNIQTLRTESGLTQLGLAEILSYSDKAVSKWERAEAIPDITVLKQIADYFGVTVDYLLEEEHNKGLSDIRYKKLQSRNRLVITTVSIFGVFSLGALIFSLLLIMNIPSPWLSFVYSVPTASIVALVLNCIWGKRSYTLIIISVLIWSSLVSAYLTLLMYLCVNWWALFLVGIPSQGILLVLSGMRSLRNRKEKKLNNGTNENDAPSA